MAVSQQDLVRKQILLTGPLSKKLADISKSQSCSETEIIRRALEAYDPSLEQELDRFIEMVAENVTEAINMTNHAIAKTTATISILEKSEKTYTERTNGRS